MSINSASSSSSQATIAENYLVKVEDIPFLEVVKINDLVCPLSKRFLLSAVQLIPCGHRFNGSALVDWYSEKKAKICPITACSQPYTFMLQDPFMTNLAIDFRSRISLAGISSTNKLRDAVQAIPVQNREVLRPILQLIKKGHFQKAMNRLTDIILTVENGEQYESMRQVMDEIMTHAETQLKDFCQQVDTPAVSSVNAQRTSVVPVTENGVAHPPISEHSLIKGKKISFLDIIKASQLVCPLSKKFLRDPIQLEPCGHYFEHDEIFKQYREKGRICPLVNCSKPYTFAVRNLFLKKVKNDFIVKASQPNQLLKDKISHLYQALPESPDKQKIKATIDLFFTGEIRNALEKLIELILTTVKNEPYTPIFKLMDEHVSHVTIKGNSLLQQAYSPAASPGSSQASITPVTGNGAAHNPLAFSGGNGIGGAHLPSAVTATPPGFTGGNLSSTTTTVTTSFEDDNEVQILNSQSRKRSATLAFDQPEESNAKRSRPEGEEQQDHPTSSAQADVGMAQAMPSSTNPSNGSVSEQVITPEMAEEHGMSLIDAIKRKQKYRIDRYIQTANLNVQDLEGNTPLHLAILYYKKAIKTLYEKGANLDAQNGNGETSLHLAAKLNKVVIVKQLVEWGASTKIRDRDNKLPSEVTVNAEAKRALR